MRCRFRNESETYSTHSLPENDRIDADQPLSLYTSLTGLRSYVATGQGSSAFWPVILAKSFGHSLLVRLVDSFVAVPSAVGVLEVEPTELTPNDNFVSVGIRDRHLRLRTLIAFSPHRPIKEALLPAVARRSLLPRVEAGRRRAILCFPSVIRPGSPRRCVAAVPAVLVRRRFVLDGTHLRPPRGRSDFPARRRSERLSLQFVQRIAFLVPTPASPGM